MTIKDEEINEIYRELIMKVGWENYNKEKIEINIEDQRVRHALAIYKSISDEKEHCNKQLEETCQKLNFIRYFCIIELILRESRKQNSRQFNSLGAILLGYEKEWWIQKVYESLNTVFDLRNKLVHEFNYGIENETANTTSDLNPEYLSSNLKKIINLLILRIVGEDRKSFIQKLRSDWNELYQYSNQIPLIVQKYEHISNNIPHSIFDESIKKIIAKNFGSEEPPENSFSLGLSAYGGLLLKTDYTINIENYFHNSSIRSSENRVLPDKTLLEEVSRVLIKEICILQKKLGFKDKSNSTKKKEGEFRLISLYSKSPQALVFEIGWLLRYVKLPIYTTLEIRNIDDNDGSKNYKFVYYRIQKKFSIDSSGESITFDKEVIQEGDSGTMIILKPKKKMIKAACDRFPNHQIISCFNKGLVINDKNEIQAYAQIIVKLIESIKSEEIFLAMRLPTALVLQLGYSVYGLGKTIHLYEWRQKNPISAPELHEFFTLRKEVIEEQMFRHTQDQYFSRTAKYPQPPQSL